MSMMDVDAEEPLLNLPVPLTPIESRGSLLTASLITEGERSDDNNNNDTENQLLLLRMLGRPYAAKTAFWTQAWPLSLALGSLLGVFVGGFLIIVHSLLDRWFADPGIGAHGEVWWLVITLVGGFLCGLIFIAPGAPTHATIRTLVHDVHDLKGHAAVAPFVVAQSLIVMATGAPLGPEIALGSLGSGLAALLSSLFKVDRRTEAGLVQAGLAGSLGALLLSPMLGVTVMQELSITGRPTGLLLDSLACSEMGHRRDGIPFLDHDWMEQITLGGTTATGVYVIVCFLAPYASSEWFQVLDLGGDAFELWHLAAAVPIGILCGGIGTLAIGLVGLFQLVRSSTCDYLHAKFKFPPWIGTLLFCSIGGAIHGGMSIWNPMLVGSGMQFVSTLVQKEVTASDVPLLVATAFGKLVSMSACIGFGLIGGPIFPMMFVGLCLGMSATPLLPISLAVPCCICATVGSVVPIPFTLVIYITFSMALSVNQIGPVFVAIVVAFSFVGGIGFVKKFGEKRLGYVAPEGTMGQAWQHPHGDEDEDVFQYEAEEDEQDEEEEERAREIRNAVFGSASPMW